MANKVEIDPCSFSNIDKFQIKHCHLEVKVNFVTHTLEGFVELLVQKDASAGDKFALDTRDLDVKEVWCSNENLKFELHPGNAAFGSKLEITLPMTLSKEFKIKIVYATSPKSTALQWLSPEQTAGKKQPYLYSQCQAIHARSLIPCQDTPGIKMTYSAKLRVPKDLVALMSAVKQETIADPEDPNCVINSFEQKVPIPSYLLAVVVGALQSKQIGPRSKVWCEVEMLDQSAYEFAETERMLSAAEKLLGPYVWGVYDLLVLPPTFPYGGMENPCLTFVTPTLLAGDRSLTLVVAHEIAHSWTGNLVTNKNHAHFWLNEGHTVFVERKIAGLLQNEAFRHFQAYGGYNGLKETLDDFGKDHPYNALVLDITGGVDPDDAFSKVPYEKGSAFLMYLEQKLGGPDVFEPFLRAYIEKFKYQSLTTDEWKQFLYEFFASKKNILEEVNWNEWFYGRYTCPAQPVFDTTLLDSVLQLSGRWIDASPSELGQFSPEDVKDHSAVVIEEFLRQLLESGKMTEEKIRKMDNLYKFSNYQNSEIKFRWLRLGIQTQMKEFIPKALQMVNEQGRMKFVRPLYKDLYQWETARQTTIENFKEQREFMHSTTAKVVAKVLNME